MSKNNHLLELEKQFWNADKEFYEEKLSENAVMVFPQPTGVLEREEIIQSLGGANRWSSVELNEVRIIEVSDSVVQVIYRGTGERKEDGSEYNALISSTYIEDGSSWKLKSHQQTPL